MVAYQNKNRKRRERIPDDIDDAKTTLDIYSGIIPKLTELIRWARYCFWVLAVIAGMMSLFFLRDALSVILRFFGV